MGEELAARWYEDAGYCVVDRNWRTSDGEIDLVARRDDLVVVCEVKTRSSDRFGAPIEAVTAEKVRRIRALAAQWLAANRARGAIRFDVASVHARADGSYTVEVVEQAF